MIFFDLDDTLIDRKRAEYLGVKGFYSEQSTLFGATEEAFYESWRTISHRHFLRFLRGEISFQTLQALL
jgi:FMN phosphatase YigB (HAD superfamily)